MARTLIAVTDSPFPSLDPAKAALERIDAELRIAKSASAEDILAVVRKITQSNALVQAGRWEIAPVVPIHRLAGRVLGLVGFGNIPRTLAPKAKAFGLRVVAHDPYVAPQVLAAAQVEGVSFDRL